MTMTSSFRNVFDRTISISTKLAKTTFLFCVCSASAFATTPLSDACDSDPSSIKYELVPTFPKLPALDGIVDLFQAPKSDRHWFAVMRDGYVLRFDNKTDADSLTTVLDIRDKTEIKNEMGLQGFAFHPNFRRNGYVFVHYNNKAKNGESTISRFVIGNDGKAILNTEKVILTQEQPADNHNGGSIVFGPDNYLYIGFGDGGRWNDQFKNGQNPATWLGTILRIDVNTDKTYRIPDDNPFVNKKGFRPEIYAWGSRNPWRFSFDMKTNELWLGDVGQDAIEEVHIVNAGDNLGWPIMEGKSCFQNKPCSKEGLNIPVADYPQGEADCSVIGGYVYRGKKNGLLDGHYLYGDFCTGTVRSTVKKKNEWISKELLTSGKRITAFAQDHQGEVYVLDYAGGAGKNISHLSLDLSCN